MARLTASPYRLIAFDLDGTLLDPEGRVRPRVRAAVRRAAATGARLALVTGRRLGHAFPVLRELGVPTAIVAANGGLAVDGERTLWQDGIDRAAARAVAGLAGRLGASVFVYRRFRRHGQAVEVLEHPPGVLPTTWSWFDRDDPALRQVPDVADPPTRPLRITVIAPPAVAAAFLARIPAAAGDRVAVFTTEDLLDGCRVIEVLPPRTHKGRALARLARRLGVSRREVLAFGDYFNDLEMLAWAGTGVAMGNAPDPVKAAADWVTAGNAEDGVAAALERLLQAPAAAAG